MNYILFTILGYLSGSILYACWLPKLICGENIVEESSDGNPGTANVYKNCGIFIGTLVLICELMKGFLPVYLAGKVTAIKSLLFTPVLVAPVLGHAFPFLHTKKGGKAIAVSFGVLLGIFPIWQPAVLLAAAYISFSLILIINPHLFRSVFTFLVFSVLNYLTCPVPSIRLGGVILSGIVILKHLIKYQNETFSMKLFRRSLL